MRKVKANLSKYIKTEAGLRYCPAVITSNGRIKQDIVLVGGKEERHPEGAYYLDWRQNGVRVRLSVGKNAQDALTQRDRKAFELNAASHGVEVVQSTGQSNNNGHSNGDRSLAAAVADYLEETRLSKKTSTLAAYKTSLSYFAESCAKLHLLDEITRKDMVAFSSFLRDEKNHSPRTVHNRFLHVLVFLKAQGIRDLVSKNDWPRFTEEEPEIYERAELDILFAACTAEETLWFEFFLMTGMREQEVVHAFWSDVNLIESTVRVTHKPTYGWSPKAYKEREIPIPAKLVTSLQAAKGARDKGCPLVFSTAGKLNLYFLEHLKAVAKRAGLNPENFWLHKFRATFGTWALWAGVDLRTAMSWMGHSDMKSTLRYLKPSRSQATRDKINAMFAGGVQ